MCLKSYVQMLGVCVAVVGGAFGLLVMALVGVAIVVAALLLGLREHSLYEDELSIRRRERWTRLMVQVHLASWWTLPIPRRGR